jgi:hypothetical protein
MRFDCVIGNPPFQAETKGDGSLWSRFIQQAHSRTVDSGFIALVLPSIFTLPGPNIRKGKINVWSAYFSKASTLVLNQGECSKYFPGVGRGPDYFSYIVSHKTANQTTRTNMITSTDTWHTNITDYEYLPVRGNRMDYQISQKIQKQAKKTPLLFRRGGNYGQNGLGNKVLVFKKALYQPYEKCIAYDLTGSRDFRKEITDFGWCLLPNSVTEKGLISVMLGKLYKHYASLAMLVTFNQGFHQMIPAMDFSKEWTDQEIYNHFGLTQEEIDYIEELVK